jgi:hypothetical protein
MSFMQCPKCHFQNDDQAAECLRCGIVFDKYWAWKTERPHLIVASGALLVFQFICTRLPYDRAQALIIFGGDGGSLVLGTVLMSTFYVRRDTAIYENSLRWGFLAIGAASFMDAYHSWSGREEDIPFGVQEGTQTDPSQLVETYGWTIQLLIHRYIQVAVACSIALTIIYIFGILQARKELKSSV